ADVESPIAVEVSRIAPVQLQPFFVGDEHRHPSSILAGIEDLFGFVIGRRKLDLRLAENGARPVAEIATIDLGRHGKARKSIEGFGVGSFAAKTAGTADTRQSHSPY